MRFNRRSFIKTAVGLFTSAASLQVVAKESEGYLYEWSDQPGNPKTNDPKHKGRLIRGLHNRVLVNGVDVGASPRFFTGPNGWVEKFTWLQIDSDQYIFTTDKDGKETTIKSDKSLVTVLLDQWNDNKIAATFNGRKYLIVPGSGYKPSDMPTTFNITSPKHVDKDGKPIYRWREEPLMQVLKGNVTFIDKRPEWPLVESEKVIVNRSLSNRRPGCGLLLE